MNLDNIVIKAKNKTHAKKIVKWFKSQGANMDFFWDNLGEYPNEKDGDYFTYYGIIDGEFEFWSQYNINSARVKIIELPKETISESINEPILNVIL